MNRWWYVALTITIVVLGASVFFLNWEKQRDIVPESTSKGYRQWLHETLADPATGKIPEGIFQQSLTFAATLPVEEVNMTKADYGIWVQRGPNNVGGRTRALAIDVDNENRMVTGAVSGGIWKTEDGGGSWQKMSADTDFTPVSCVAQDTRKGKTNTWYVGTGEYFGSYFPMGDYINGNGIRKSTDNGRTWQRLITTYNSNQTTNYSFSYVHRLATNPAIDSLDVVFAAAIDGIYRSTDGGKIWIRKRGALNSWGFTEVAVDKNGIVYAVLDGSYAQKGIWRSVDNGQTWTNISPVWYTSAMRRTVICISPDDPNQLYFLTHSPGLGKKTSDNEWHSLWKYTYVSGDGSGTGGQWEDRSQSIPGDSTSLYYGRYMSQMGYCMHVRVRPHHPDEIYLGGISLFKSTDGFKSTKHTSQIGGARPDGADYELFIGIPNQHGDEHDIIFSPSNDKKAITISDGGIEYTNDISANSITWNSLNSGYMSTQFYTVGILHNNTSPIIFGGLQDNGVRFVNSESYVKPWTLPVEGDGMGIYPGTGSDNYYMACQNGWLARIKLDADLNSTMVSYLSPIRLSKISLFATAYLVDEQNRSRIYLADGQFLQRNDDVTQNPLVDKIDTSVKVKGWSLMNGCVAPDSSSITQLIFGKAQNDVIYFGTNTGKLMRIRNASTQAAVVENLTGSNFPHAYITCIETDDRDSNSIYCVFSNFGIQSVFYSNDGGANWTAVSGNLEQYANGTGAGPSCRWLTIAHLPDTTLYFLGTSAGLYATTKIDGGNTVWVRQGPHNIGLNWVTMMDFRTTDYTMAVATYGAGVFTAKISSLDRTGMAQQMQANEVTLFPNPVIDKFRIQIPESWQQTPYEIIDSKGEVIIKGYYRRNEEIEMTGHNKGHYILRLRQHSAIITKRIVYVGEGS